MTGVAYRQSLNQAPAEPEAANAYGEPVRIIIPAASAAPAWRMRFDAAMEALRPYADQTRKRFFRWRATAAPYASAAGNRIGNYVRPRLTAQIEIFKDRQWQRRVLGTLAFYIAIGIFAVGTVITAGALLFERDGAPSQTTAIVTVADSATQNDNVSSISPWVRLSKPITLYSIDAPEFSRLPQQHQARRHTTGNGREDILTVGAFEKPQLYYTVRIYRPGGEKTPENTLYVDTVRRAADAGMTVQRMAAAEQHRTKFGPATVADVTLQEGERQRGCLTFRLATANAALTINGLACGAEARQIDRATLTCFIDRISLVAAGDDPQVRQAFADAELSRHAGCTKSSLTAVGRKATWLDVDGAAPAFKTTVAETEKPVTGKKKKVRNSRGQKTAARDH